MLPKMTQIFLERADLGSPAFRAWFRNSKVVDEQGRPLVVYHGTKSIGDFHVFRDSRDLGHHFGTAAAANARLLNTDHENARPEGPQRIYPVYLSIQNPIELPDLMTWEGSDILWALQQAELIDADDYDEIASISDRDRQMGDLLELLGRKGFDGALYKNNVEDEGSISWIAFDSGQIKSVYNRGTWDKRRGSIME